MSEIEDTRAFVAHLRAEHGRLHKLLREAEQQWPVAAEVVAQVGEAPRLIEGLLQLRDELVRHFEQEERGGCLEEAVCRCPSLSEEASRIENEHPLLLGQLEQIIVRVRAGRLAVDSAGETQRDFQEFARRLRAHEAAENRILSQALGTHIEELETT